MASRTSWIARVAVAAVVVLVPLSVVGYRYAPAAVAWFDDESCVGCHRERNERLVGQWIDSAHFAARLGCEGCHGTDHDAMFAADGDVSPEICGKCHEAAYKGFAKSAHARAAQDARDNARFKVAPPAMQRQGCMSCHAIGKSFPDGGTGRCNDCHAGHLFAAAEAREPRACEGCHMGPDHPQAEAWRASKHGIVYRGLKDEAISPTCVGCHVGGSSRHDFDVRPEEIAATCERCHAKGFVRRHLADAEEIGRIADGLVAEAAQILRELNDEGLLAPSPADRPAHPEAGHTMVLGGEQLYSDTTAVEQTFFEMTKFHHATTVKGANHFSPDHVHWLGYARLQANLTRIRDAARRLRAERKD